MLDSTPDETKGLSSGSPLTRLDKPLMKLSFPTKSSVEQNHHSIIIASSQLAYNSQVYTKWESHTFYQFCQTKQVL